MRRKGTNAVRIIGGAWRSRLVRFPDAADLRPTPGRVRETLFNWLGQDLSGKRCLDLFAGSGALGFEALSRGAAEVVMVETSRAAHSALRESATRLGAGGRLRLVHGDALHFIATSGHSGYDIVFVDPPYGSGLAGEALARLPRVLASGGIVYVESDSPLALDPPWRERRHGRAGAVHYRLIEWGGHDDGSLSGHI
ncbi:MAG TPA: 16S rRNA (guanine(966)-N(2))-methyltransferase RsmD [Burkholderiales bacterium]|nr:16S rRNA (guanine(966)-N(2))-methyltransferase RsmD [Burkholderiales bacterium]